MKCCHVDKLKPVNLLDPKEFVKIAYQKHAAELVAIEDRLNKLLLVIIGIFGAGATAIPHIPLKLPSTIALCVVVLLFGAFGLHYTYEMHDLRRAVRCLLVRCEIAMNFYHDYSFLEKETLYTANELRYAEKGGFLTGTYTACVVVAALGLIFLICSYYCQTMD